MTNARSECVIHAEPEKVYEGLKNITMWTDIFPPCQKARVISWKDGVELVELTALTKGKLFSWTSKRIHNDKELSISFQQMEPAYPLGYMSGIWSVQPYQGQSKVILTHEFEVKWKLFRKFTGFIAKKFFVDANSEREVRGLKEYCERTKE